MIADLTRSLPTWFRAFRIVHLWTLSITISEFHYWNLRKNFFMLFIWCQENLKFLRYASGILKVSLLSDVLVLPRSRNLSLNSRLFLSTFVLTILSFLPLCISYFSKSYQSLSNFLLSEQILLYRKAWL